MNANFIKYFPDAEIPMEKGWDGRRCCMQSAELMSAIERSGRSYEEILALLKSKSEK